MSKKKAKKLTAQQTKKLLACRDDGCPRWMAKVFGSALWCDRCLVIGMTMLFMVMATLLIVYTGMMTIAYSIRDSELQAQMMDK